MPDGLTPDQAACWAAFRASPEAPPDADRRFHSTFGVGPGTDADAAPILTGAKTATSALPGDFAPGLPPAKGSLSLLTGTKGRPLAVIETLSLTPLSLDQLDADFIAAYGEWQGEAAFRAGMLRWYQAQDPSFTPQTLLLAERFRLIWTAPPSR